MGYHSFHWARGDWESCTKLPALDSPRFMARPFPMWAATWGFLRPCRFPGAETAAHKDFILDRYIPAPMREAVAVFLERLGYYVVNIQLQKAQSRPRAKEMAPRGSCARSMEHLREEFLIDEEEYLAGKPDVAAALRAVTIRRALAHHILYGRAEGRKRAPDGKGEADEARKDEPCGGTKRCQSLTMALATCPMRVLKKSLTAFFVMEFSLAA